MDLNFTPEEEAFRDEVRAFLADKLPARLSDKVASGKHLGKADMEEWHAILNARGWLANHWPEQYGGPGWTAVQKFIFEDECALARAPRIVPFGVNMLGPVLIKYGNEAQKRHWLPRILDGRDWWCQGYSEPGAGSDLASVKTRAVRASSEGDHYVVNGQKTWTTLGQHANMIFCLVRTNREAQEAGGHQLPADRHEVARRRGAADHHARRRARGQRGVLHRRARAGREPGRRGEQGLDLRQVPADLRAHQHRRRRLLGGRAASSSRRIAATQTKNGRPLAEDPRLRRAHGAGRDRPGEHEDDQPARDRGRGRRRRAGRGELDAQDPRHRDPAGDHVADRGARWGPMRGPSSPRRCEDGFDGEPIGPTYAAPAAAQYFNNRKLSIFGGSNEIQKNIISKMILGL